MCQSKNPKYKKQNKKVALKNNGNVKKNDKKIQAQIYGARKKNKEHKRFNQDEEKKVRKIKPKKEQ